MRSVRSLFALLAILVVPLVSLPAFQFYPMVVVLEPEGPGSRHQFVVENSTEEILAVEISITTREIAQDGTEQNRDASREFSIYPSQIVLRPGQKQFVRVEYQGDQNLRRERAYRIVAEQLPVNLSGTQAEGNRIQFALRYRGALYVAPAGAAPDLRVLGARINRAGQLELRLENRGSAHTKIGERRLILEAEGELPPMQEEADASMREETILAGQRRRFILPLQGSVEPQEVRVSLESPEE